MHLEVVCRHVGSEGIRLTVILLSVVLIRSLLDALEETLGGTDAVDRFIESTLPS